MTYRSQLGVEPLAKVATFGAGASVIPAKAGIQ